MITSLVIVSRQPNGSAPSFRLPTTLEVTKFPVVHPLSIQPLTKCSSRNSFILKTIHFDWGAYPSTFGRSQPSDVSTCSRAIPFPLKLLRTLLRFFALTKITTHLFPSDSALFAKNTGGGWRGDAGLRGAATRKLGAAMCAIGGRFPASDLSGWISSGQYIDFYKSPCRCLASLDISESEII